MDKKIQCVIETENSRQDVNTKSSQTRLLTIDSTWLTRSTTVYN